MDQQNKTTPNEPLPCTKGCGFFGRASTDGMCSKCFKENIQATATMPAKQVAVTLNVPSIPAGDLNKKIKMEVLVEPVPSSKESSSSSSAATAEAPVEAPVPVVAKVDRTRCAECRKKVGLTGIECRCGKVYCGGHRQAEKHACTFDFKEFGRRNIEKANERVVAQSLVDKL